MKKNVGNLDRLIRIAFALLIAVLIFTGSVTEGWGIFLSVIGGFFLLTGVAGDCPIYWLLGINTVHAKNMKGSH